MIAGQRPVDAGLAGRADHLFGLPVDDEGGQIESLARLGLPADIRAHRTEQFDAMPGLAGHPQIGVDVTGIGEVGGGRQAFIHQRLLDRGCQITVGDRRKSGFDVNDQMRRVGVAGFGDVDFVAGPSGAALATVAGIGIVGGVETGAGGR